MVLTQRAEDPAPTGGDAAGVPCIGDIKFVADEKSDDGGTPYEIGIDGLVVFVSVVIVVAVVVVKCG